MFKTNLSLFTLTLVVVYARAQHFAQQSQDQQQQQYPRIKIAGPLGQLIGGNGISLGSGLGAVLNSLVSTAGAVNGGGSGSPIGTSGLTPFGSSSSASGHGLQIRSPFGGQIPLSLSQMPSISGSSLYSGSMPSLYATSASQQQKHSFNSFPNYDNFNSFEALYGQSSNPIPYNIFGSSHSSHPSLSSSSSSSLYGHSIPESNSHLLNVE